MKNNDKKKDLTGEESNLIFRLNNTEETPHIDAYLAPPTEFHQVGISYEKGKAQVIFYLYPDNDLEMKLIEENGEELIFETGENLKVVFNRPGITEAELLEYAYPHIKDTIFSDFVYLK